MPKRTYHTIGVDAGMIWLGDPCYIIGADSSHGPLTWADFCKDLDRSEKADGSGVQEPLGSGIGLAIPSGYGDGAYRVIVTTNDEGRVTRAEIVFIDEELKEPVFCDHCGETIHMEHELVSIGEMPVEFDSGNAGESASLCVPCHNLLIP